MAGQPREIIGTDDEESFDRWKQGCAHALARATVETQFDCEDAHTRDRAVHEFGTLWLETAMLDKVEAIPFLRRIMCDNIEGVVRDVSETAEYGVHWFTPEQSAEVYLLVVASWADDKTGNYTEVQLPITGDIPGFTDDQPNVMEYLADSKVYKAV